jgi:hypothetical protein
MCDINKEKAEAFWRMSEAATNRVSVRQSYEWQLNLALWTPIALGTAWLVANHDSPIQCSLKWVAAILILAVWFCYVFLWRIGLEKGNNDDRQKAIYWAHMYLRHVGVHADELACDRLFPPWAMAPGTTDDVTGGKPAKKRILGLDCKVEWPKMRLLRWKWSVLYQMSITTILCVALGMTILTTQSGGNTQGKNNDMRAEDARLKETVEMCLLRDENAALKRTLDAMQKPQTSSSPAIRGASSGGP